MPQDTLEFRVTVQRLIIGLLITVVPLGLFTLYTISNSADDLEEKIGLHFKTVAAATAADIALFIHSRVTQVAFMATDPSILVTAETANASYRGMSDAAFTEKIQKIEKSWNTPAADPLMIQISSSVASQALTRYLGIDPSFVRIFLCDGSLSVVGGTHKSLRYYQGDQESWQGVYNNGLCRFSRNGRASAPR